MLRIGLKSMEIRLYLWGVRRRESRAIGCRGRSRQLRRRAGESTSHHSSTCTPGPSNTPSTGRCARQTRRRRSPPIRVATGSASCRGRSTRAPAIPCRAVPETSPRRSRHRWRSAGRPRRMRRQAPGDARRRRRRSARARSSCGSAPSGALRHVTLLSKLAGISGSPNRLRGLP